MSNFYHDPNDTRVPYGQQPQPPAYAQPQQPAGWRAPAYQPPVYQQPVYQQPAPQNVNINVNVSGGSSYFDGGLLQQIGLGIVNFFIILCTAGICTPWAICRKYKWVQKHTVIEGRRLRFDGTAMGLFGTWIKWLFLCLITAGIYSLWVGIDLKKWITKHTHFDA